MLRLHTCAFGVLLLASACFGGGKAVIADDGDAGARDASGTQGGGRTGGPNCLFAQTTSEISVTNVDKVDLLFVVDDSPSMQEEQGLLREQFPRLIEVLATGDRDGDGVRDFPPARDLHLGVVSSDLGVAGLDGVSGCSGLGDDGVMNSIPDPAVAGCQASYPRFLTYVAGIDEPQTAALDFACVASLGSAGCSFEQPLEAGLKALWPSIDIDPNTGEVLSQNRITFLGDMSGAGQDGHGDVENNGFVRNDPTAGISLIAIVVVSDENDCSTADPSMFRPAAQLDPGNPLAEQELDLRCFYNPQNLFMVARYVNGFKALRPGQEHLVVFAGIVGVPPDLVDDAADLDDDVARDAYYDAMLDDPRMIETVDPTRTEGDGLLVPSCLSDLDGDGAVDVRAYPPRRIVEVARRFGDNGLIRSICQPDLTPATDAIVDVISRQLGAICLPRPLVRDDDGVVGCDVVWQLPPPPSAPAGTPTDCSQRDFLSPAEAVSGARGGVVCIVEQVPVLSSAAPEGSSQGWYYDDFSEDVERQCNGQSRQRISFTVDARPPSRVSVQLRCLSETPPNTDCDEAFGVGTDISEVGSPCLPGTVPESGFDDREAYVETNSEDCGGGACLVYRLRGDPRSGCVEPPPEPCRPDDTECRQGSVRCASPDEVQDRVYCSCRCGEPDGCGCPDGFSCVPALSSGPEDVRGSYCVRDGTFTR